MLHFLIILIFLLFLLFGSSLVLFEYMNQKLLANKTH